MSNEIPKHRPHLTTLAEAINILRDALRDLFVSSVSKEAILAELEPIFKNKNRSQAERDKFDKCQKGKMDIRDILDINVICQSNLINKTRINDKKGVKNSMKNMDKYRNMVCHPSFEDIPEGVLKRYLKRIHTLLITIKKREEAQVVDTLWQNPYTKSHYKYHITSNNSLERAEQERDKPKAQAQESQRQLAQAKQARKTSDQTSKLIQAELEKERDTAIEGKRQSAVTLERTVRERDEKIKLYRRTTFSISVLAVVAASLPFLLNFQQRENTRQLTTDNTVQQPTPNSASIVYPTAEPNLDPMPSSSPIVIPAIAPTIMPTPMITATLRPSPVPPTVTLPPLPSVPTGKRPEIITEVRMYAGPSIEFEVKGEILQAGTRVEVLGVDSSRDWYVLANRYWIPALAVRFAPDDLTVTSAPYVLTGANLREEPTTDSPVQGGVSAGNIIVVVGQKEGGPPAGTWYQLDSGLWIYGELVADIPPNLPVFP